MMQHFDFIQSHILVLALGLLFVKSIVFLIYLINKKRDDEIIEKNLSITKKAIQQQTQVQQSQQPQLSSIDVVNNWRTEDFRLSQDMRQQFLTKTKTRRTPTSDRASPREKVPLATTDLEVSIRKTDKT